ncbi:MAG: hypothetical protein WAL20_12535, partial [Rhodomicrobium sp.]
CLPFPSSVGGTGGLSPKTFSKPVYSNREKYRETRIYERKAEARASLPFMFRAFFSVRSQKDNREMHRQNREFASQVPMQNYLVQNGAIACLIVQFYSGECGFTLVSAISPSVLHPGL